MAPNIDSGWLAARRRDSKMKGEREEASKSEKEEVNE
jgi:hypothetical protein